MFMPLHVKNRASYPDSVLVHAEAPVHACACVHVCLCNLTVYAAKLELIKGSVKQRECNYQT